MASISGRDAILGGIAAFIAWGYAVHWFPVIRWTGHAFVGGVLVGIGAIGALTLLVSRGSDSFEEYVDGRRRRRRRRAERTALPHGVAFSGPEAWQSEVAALQARQAYEPAKLYPPSDRISSALDEIIALILRDFVSSWYDGIRGADAGGSEQLPPAPPVFANEVDRVLRHALGSIRDRLLAQDLVAVFTARLVPILTAHVRDFGEAERAVRGRKLNRTMTTEAEELDRAIAAKYRGDGKLHPAVGPATQGSSDGGGGGGDSGGAGGLASGDGSAGSRGGIMGDRPAVAPQQDYLRRLVETRILPAVLPAHLLASGAVAAVIREIVACAVLVPVAQLLADPDTWNMLMESYGRSVLQDRSTVRRLRAALDQHAPSAVPRGPGGVVDKVAQFPRLAPGDSERKFEKFVRAIRRVNNLSDARRLRSEVAAILKRESQVEDKEKQDAVYLRRLDVGKRLLDQRVQYLAAGGGSRRAPSAPSHVATATGTAAAGPGAGPSGASSSKLENASLGELLKDASGLMYFMEYMDRLKLLPLVQFWLVVDGLRNPLEDDTLEDEHLPTTMSRWTDSDRLDIAQIDQEYLGRPELKVPEQSRRVVRDFLDAGAAATPEQYHRARREILRAQTAVLEDMQANYFRGFKKSDLFYKCLAAHEAAAPAPQQPPAPAAPSRGPSSRDGSLAPPLTRVSLSYSAKPTPVSRIAPRRAAETLGAKRAGSATDVRTSSLLNGSGGSSGSSINGIDSLTAPRRSLDDSAPAPLFDDDDLENDALADSVQSLDAEPRPPVPDTRVVQAMEEALNNIMEDSQPRTAEDLRRSLFGDDDAGSSIFEDMGGPASHRGSLDLARPSGQETGARTTSSTHKEPEKEKKPSLASLGLVSAHSRIGVFVDDDLFADEDRFLEDEQDDVDEADNDDAAEDEVHEAAPGDLGLAEAITALSNDIDRLVAQEAVIDSLTKKAELTNNTAELRILRKSKASLEREIRRKELQRQQYVIQESDNSLYGRSTVRIKTVQVGRDDDGREFAVYVVEVSRNAGEKMPAAAWVVTRRYSEFLDLHQRLRQRYPSVRNLDFPRRRVVMKLQSDFLRKRRLALEKYLSALLLLPDVCRSRELRAFLSQSAIVGGDDVADREDKKDMISRLYDSVTDGVEDILGNIPVLDQLSLAGQNLIAAATNQLNASATMAGVASSEDAATAAEAEAELDAFEAGKPTELEPFVKPICDIFLEIFELNRGNNWLRGRAVVVVLHQLLGGTIERKVRDNFRALFQQEDGVVRNLNLLRDALWPNGARLGSRPPRTPLERAKTRTEASLMLATLVPDLAGSVVGRVNAQAASRRIFATLNNQRLK